MYSCASLRSAAASASVRGSRTRPCSSRALTAQSISSPGLNARLRSVPRGVPVSLAGTRPRPPANRTKTPNGSTLSTVAFSTSPTLGRGGGAVGGRGFSVPPSDAGCAGSGLGARAFTERLIRSPFLASCSTFSTWTWTWPPAARGGERGAPRQHRVAPVGPLHLELQLLADEGGGVGDELQVDLRHGAEGALTVDLDLQAALVHRLHHALDREPAPRRLRERLAVALRSPEPAAARHEHAALAALHHHAIDDVAEIGRA